MLLQLCDYNDIDERKLMDVYSESNAENADYFYPDETDKAAAVKKVEARFMEFLKDEFYHYPEAAYWILEENGMWTSALRTCRIREGLYYLEALETRPDQRKKGYGALLLSYVIEELKKYGPFRLCDCVSKKNAALLKTHEKCGFRILSDTGYDYLRSENDAYDYGLEYCYSAE